jgi:hypothetical protein
MTYFWIFIGSYVVAGALVLSHFLRKNSAAAALLGNPSSQAVRNFHKMMWEKSILLLVWATFVFGSVAGGVIAVIYWFVSR